MNDEIKYGGTCKHNNGPDCQQCQYERDVASGYPEPWRLWLYYTGWHKNEWIAFDKQITSEQWNNLKVRNRRRPDADEIIKEWEKEQRKENYKPVSVLRDEWLAKQADKCATCRHNHEALPEPMREEPKLGGIVYGIYHEKNIVMRVVWKYRYSDAIRAGLIHKKKRDARQWLDWWNRAVGRTD